MITLKTSLRSAGAKLVEARKKGLIPAVYYGNGSNPVSIFLDRIEFQKVYKQAGVTTIVTLEANGAKVNTLIHDVSHDTMTGMISHVDFMIVDAVHTMQVTVPIEFIGTAPGEKTHSATVVKILHSIEVEAMAIDIPQSMHVDLGILLELDSHITVGDLRLPKGVKIHHLKPTDIIASLSVQKVKEEDIAEVPSAE